MENHIYYLFVLAMPVACIAWTVTKEDIFKEVREFCVDRSKNERRLAKRKFFYVFTCEYCFSHYVTLILLFITNFKLIYMDWRGYIISFVEKVLISDINKSLNNIIRIDLIQEKSREAKEESELKEQ